MERESFLSLTTTLCTHADVPVGSCTVANASMGLEDRFNQLDLSRERELLHNPEFVDFFEGANDLNVEEINDLCKRKNQALGAEEFLRSPLCTDNPDSLVQKTKDMLTSFSNNGDGARLLLSELQYYIDSEGVNYGYLVNLVLRHAASLNTARIDNPLELRLIRSSIESALTKDSWKTESTWQSIKFDQHLKDYRLTPEQAEEIALTLNKHYSTTRLFYPIFTRSILGVATMVKLMIHNVCVLGYPSCSTESIRAHGTKLNPLAFIAHDIDHDDAMINFLELNVTRSAGEHIQNGGDFQNFVTYYIPYAAEKIVRLNFFLKSIYDNLLSDLETGTETVKRRAKHLINGLFWILHEFQTSKSPFFLGTNIENIINSLVADYDPGGLLNPINPFYTDHVTGETLMTDEQIIDCFWEMGSNTSASLPPKYITSVRRSPIFIDVEITSTDGIVTEGSFRTLRYQYNDALDYKSLLKFAALAPEVIEGYPAVVTTEDAINKIKSIGDGFKSLVEEASIYILEHGNGALRSAREEFDTWNRTQLARIQNFLTHHTTAATSESAPA